MPNNAAQADHLKRWDVALVAGEANSSEPGVEDIRTQLATAAEGAKGAIARQALLRFQLQQTTRDLDAFMAMGKEAYSRLVLVVKGRYGLKAEKLNEWGIQPFRPPVRSKESTAKKKPPENGQSPTQAARSQTESTT